MKSLIVAGIIVVATAILITAAPDGESRYRVAAVFDTADGIAPGFVVKVAGVEVGKVTAVRLTPELKASTELEVDPAFAPFRADASCRILPQSLISEKFVDCTPGKHPRALAPDAGTTLPTVPLSRTSVPVAIQDVLDVFAAPAPDRLRLLLNELGLSIAGRAGDVNEILRRANPMLGKANRTLEILNEQGDELGQAIAQTDTVVAKLAANDDDVRTFVARAADLASTTAQRREQLRGAVRDLPRLLRSATGSLGELRRTADATTPLLPSVRAAAPRLEQFANLAVPFTKDATPAVDALVSAARTGRRTARSTASIAKRIDTFAESARAPMALIRAFSVDLRDRGGIEGLQKFLYVLSSLTANYDRVSHLVTAQLTAQSCVATPTVPGCDGTFIGQARQDAAGARARTPRDSKPAAKKPRPKASRPAAPVPVPSGSAPAVPRPKTPVPDAEVLLDKILGGLGVTRSDNDSKAPSGQSDAAAEAFLDYLLGN